ncbi:MAG TPA: hypothetical protein VE971_03875 [Candidatus Eisenbacteria bacterium]|nr:hypothetical protein [Candidatus Eisenbacteria bacterium]
MIAPARAIQTEHGRVTMTLNKSPYGNRVWIDITDLFLGIDDLRELKGMIGEMIKELELANDESSSKT